MNTNSLSLNDLYDIVVPEPVSWWPLAPGWWILIAVVVAASGYLLFRHLQYRRENAYRREALRQLDDVNSAAETVSILRRTALAAYPRKASASLSGEQWIEWLESTANLPLPENVKTTFEGIYSETEPDYEALRNYARQWILQHPAKEGGPC
ncbi:MAG: DUF4381 domain-containing protein [Verrucomicrobiota bacterium]